MAKDPEPDVNIGAGSAMPFSDPGSGEPRSRAEAVVDRLGSLYWRKTYGGQDAFTCLVRTVLSQNTSDVASQPAFEELRDRHDDGDLAERLAGASETDIADAIRSAGLYNQKARVLRNAAQWVLSDYGGSDGFDEFVASAEYSVARESLLSVDGVGPKTADCVLLFAGGREGIFPVDTHVHRIARRIGIAPAGGDHEAVREALEGSDGVPAEKCGFGHTAMIQFGREYCTARSPVCVSSEESCPLFDLCDRVGVDAETGEGVDPASAETNA